MTPGTAQVETRFASAKDRRTHYRDHGYLLAAGAASETFLTGIEQILAELVEESIQEWRRAGLLVESLSDPDLGSRYHTAWVAADRPAIGKSTDDLRFLDRVRDSYVRQEWLVGLAAELTGREQMTAIDACCYRVSFPRDQNAALPWHQDAQCLSPVGQTDFITAWIPLVDVTDDNPCLEISPLPESHHLFQPTYSDSSEYVCMRAADIDGLTNRRAISVRRSDVLFMSSTIPHRSVVNRGSQIRWSVEFRYVPR